MGWLYTQISAAQSGYQDQETNSRLTAHTLTTEDYNKYLGVELQSTFSWNKHIDQTVKKANRMVGFLRRNLRVSSEATKASAYYSMVRPLLEYVPLFGVPIPRNISRRLRWFSVEQPGMSQIDTITQVVRPLCWTTWNGTTWNGKPWSQEEPRTSSSCSSILYMALWTYL